MAMTTKLKVVFGANIFAFANLCSFRLLHASHTHIHFIHLAGIFIALNKKKNIKKIQIQIRVLLTFFFPRNKNSFYFYVFATLRIPVTVQAQTTRAHEKFKFQDRNKIIQFCNTQIKFWTSVTHTVILGTVCHTSSF